MANEEDLEQEELPPGEQALREAGFHPLTASVLATANRLLFPVTLLVSIGALVWIGVHLWPDLDEEGWQQWTDRNPAFFAPLKPGDTVAIIPEFHSHAGLTVTRTAGGVDVERHLWFPFDDVAVGLVVQPEVAERWLQLDQSDANFWSEWHALAAGPGVRVYQHLDATTRPATGYREFLAGLQPLSPR